MMSARRLEADRAGLRRLADRGRITDLIEIGWTPDAHRLPFSFQFTLPCPGIVDYRVDAEGRSARGDITLRESHRIQLTFLEGHPDTQRPPQVVIQDDPPALHPNINRNGRICYGDWNPHWEMSDLVRELEMVISYDPAKLNFKKADVLSRPAQVWASQNTHLFPLATLVEPAPLIRRLR